MSINLSQLIFKKFIENDNNKIISILMQVIYIYNRFLKIKKLKYFYEFYRKSLKKPKHNKKLFRDKLFNDIKKRNKSRKALEKKFYGKEEEMCTFSPKINKSNFFNYKPTNYFYDENINPNIQSYNNMQPIIILPSTSRIYCYNDKNRDIKFDKLLKNFIEKSSTIPIDNDDSLTENRKEIDCIYDYSGKKTVARKNKNMSILNDMISNNKSRPKNKFNYSNIKKLISTYKNNSNRYFEEEKSFPINREYYNTFRDKISYNNDFSKINTIYKTNNFLKLNSTKKIVTPLNDFMEQVPKTCRKAYTALNLLEKNTLKSTKINKIYHLNDKINKIYLKNFVKKNYNNPKALNKRRIQLTKQRQRVNTQNTNNETKGCSASSLSARDIQFNKTNSKRDNNRSNVSNFTTNYKSKSVMSKRNKNNINSKANNKNIGTINENYMTLQSLSDSKMMELAEYFINKNDKDDLLDDIKIKKILCFKTNKNKYKNITFSE